VQNVPFPELAGVSMRRVIRIALLVCMLGFASVTVANNAGATVKADDPPSIQAFSGFFSLNTVCRVNAAARKAQGYTIWPADAVENGCLYDSRFGYYFYYN
jgi:hypothetical protein